MVEKVFFFRRGGGATFRNGDVSWVYTFKGLLNPKTVFLAVGICVCVCIISVIAK